LGRTSRRFGLRDSSITPSLRRRCEVSKCWSWFSRKNRIRHRSLTSQTIILWGSLCGL
jgi:hypothetical protein